MRKRRHLKTCYEHQQVLDIIHVYGGSISHEDLVDELNQIRIRDPSYIINTVIEDGYVYYEKRKYKLR